MAFVIAWNIVVLVLGLKLYRYLYGNKPKPKKRRKNVYKEVFLGIVDGLKQQNGSGGK